MARQLTGKYLRCGFAALADGVSAMCSAVFAVADFSAMRQVQQG